MKATVQNQLQEDHRNVAWLLGAMGRELEHLRKVEQADMDLLRDIMRYMTSYPDQVHHPLEDLMFKSLLEREPESIRKLGRLFEEHEQLAKLGKSFEALLEQIIQGEFVERDKLCDAGEQYCSLLRNHMTYENQVVFPLAEISLNDEDWALVAERFAEQKDPVFGPSRDADFANLLAFIAREAV